jgi:glutamine---fructose-6-phosphate transaminase (isomerizing)
MCGIFGLIVKKDSHYNKHFIRKTFHALALNSESRGKDSSGLAIKNIRNNEIEVFKGDISISDLLTNTGLIQSLEKAFLDLEEGMGFSAIGHARLVTNGSQLKEVNNQPVIKDNIILVHNGIIVNVDEIWEKNYDLEREFLIDTEILPTLIRRDLRKGTNLFSATDNAFQSVIGTFSVAIMFADRDDLVLSTNNGSLYYISDHQSFLIFASEEYFLKRLRFGNSLGRIFKNSEIIQLKPGSSVLLNTLTHKKIIHTIGISNETLRNESYPPKNIKKNIIDNKNFKREAVIDPSIFNKRNKEDKLYRMLEYNIDSINSLRRCIKCLLPETFPFIRYDQKGVCNYCNSYKKKMQSKDLDELKNLVEPYHHKDGTSDCIVPFSGGRDSTYTLHIIKKELKLNPIAFTYDWGMVTDLARRNIARVCGKLGVENIIVSADIRWKRENIRKNIIAWLKNPDLGMVPLFMAGDKYFFYYCNQVKKQTGIDLNIWGINPLENTEFKTGFAGLAPEFNKKRIYSLSIQNQMKLFGNIAANIIKSPGYINQSVLDSLGSFAVRYIAPKRDYYHLFDYYKWDEKGINELIKEEYNWETAIDTNSTWRIGDGTASFYNYIYCTVAGFSEIDTFRSNQIREGMLTRDEALNLVKKENLPRYETLRWYLEILGLDFEHVIKVINNIPKLYPN